MLGQTIEGRYRLLRVLGQGAMGAVYEAEHTGTGRHVAVKLIAPAEHNQAQLVQRFQREARAAGSIDTQHIVQVYDTGTDPTTGAPYMVMELLKGEDLQALLGRLGTLAPDLALRIVGQACAGLAKAHAAGVVHRDVKPANLFLARREDDEIVVKVVDFGVAKMRVAAGGLDDPALTRTGTLLGSPLYMSPEQAVGKKTVDHRSDVWSLGAVLYQALVGRVAYAHCDSLGSLIIAICGEPVTPLHEVAPWVPAETASVAHAALTIDVDARLQSADAMLEAIRRLLPGGFGIRAEMLVPLSQAERESVAPRASRPVEPAGPPAAPGPGVERASDAGRASLAEERRRPTLPAASPAIVEASIPAGATDGLGVTGATAPARSGRALVLAAFAAVALVGGGAAIYALGGHAAPAEPSGAQKPPATAAAAAPSPAASPSSAPAAQERPPPSGAATVAASAALPGWSKPDGGALKGAKPAPSGRLFGKLPRPGAGAAAAPTAGAGAEAPLPVEPAAAPAPAPAPAEGDGLTRQRCFDHDTKQEIPCP